jgi:hypothetical protein
MSMRRRRSYLKQGKPGCHGGGVGNSHEQHKHGAVVMGSVDGGVAVRWNGMGYGDQRVGKAWRTRVQADEGGTEAPPPCPFRSMAMVV